MNDLFNGTMQGEQRMELACKFFNIHYATLNNETRELIEKILNRCEQLAVFEFQRNCFNFGRGFKLGKL